MFNRYNYSNLIKPLLNTNSSEYKEIIKTEELDKFNTQVLNNKKLYILDDKIIENIEKICKYINFFENIYEKTKQNIFYLYFKLTKKVHAQ